MNSTSKVLILGGTSYLGNFIFKKLGLEFSIPSYHSAQIEGGFYFDATKQRIVEQDIDFKNFSHAIILLGHTSPDYCKKHRGESYELNVTRINKNINKQVIYKKFLK